MTPTSPDALASISINDVRSFLDQQGWHALVTPSGKRIETWIKGKPGRSALPAVHLPLESDLADFVPLLAQLLRTVSEEEDISRADLLVELTHRRATLITLGVE